MDETQRVIIPYVPRPAQWEIHQQMDKHRWSVLVIHRRFGKTYLLINHLVKDALTTTKEHARYVYIAPFLKQAKTLAWDYLKRFVDPVPNRVFHESELKVTLPNGSQIRLFGADNPDALRGIYVDGAVIDEYATADPKVFTSILRPALSDRQGWCCFSGTPNGRNHFYDMLQHAKESPDWYWTILKASETEILTPAELADARRTMTAEEYDREYECSFESIIGKRIYPEFRHSIHVARESIAPTVPSQIIRGWDNTGLSPAVNLSYLTNTGQWRIFKEFCFFDVGIMEAVEAVVLWCNRFLPQGCTFEDYADPAGRNRDTTKMSPRDYMVLKSREMGYGEMYPIDGIQTWKIRRESVANRLTSLRNGEPGILVDPSCEMIIQGFDGGYAYREIANMPGFFAEEAVKNEYSHIHDSIQYPATRLFTQFNDRRIISLGGDHYIYDEDHPNFEEELHGRSAVGGY